jgi:acetyl esterase/lipase
MQSPKTLLVAALLTLALTPITQARVTSVEIDHREDVLRGRPFGLAGPYEKLVGKVHFAVRPDNPHNRAVVDIEAAPTDDAGEVTFTADLYVLRPKNPAKGNGSLFMEISNRGGKAMISRLNRAEGSIDPTEPAHFGDGFLLNRGFTLVWVGWQFDVRDAEGLVRLYPPVASGKTGLVRSDFTLPEPTELQPIGHVIVGRIGGKEYPVADPTSRRNTLTVRDRPEAPRTRIQRGDWSFAEEDGEITGIRYPAGFEPGRIYELIYAAADPALVGLGLVAVRDFASYAKHDPEAIAPVERAIAFGISQSGRFLRQLLYQGFNADEEGRMAFDGVMAHVAGAGRGSFNHRFAQPSRDGQPMDAIFYPTDLYPFTDAPTTDPVTGRGEGLLDRVEALGVAPKFFQSNTSYDYWGRAGSLIHTTPDGAKDAPIPDNVRIYHLAGLQHFSRPLPPRKMTVPHIRGRWIINPNPSAPTMRALVVAMQNWVRGDAEPPPSTYPRIDEGTLVPLETVQKKFPAIPEVELPTDVHRAYRMDYGPNWREGGIITEHPPKVGQAFPVLVPDVDEDGNERGGIRIPQLEVPVATYTPWNLRDPSIGAPEQRVSFLGSYFPFAEDEEKREAAGDPRPSLDARYESVDDYLGKYSEATIALMRRGFVLPEDVAGIVARGQEEWRYVTEGTEQPLLTAGLDHLVGLRRDMRFAYGDAPFQFGELRLPDGTGPHPVAIVIHGGCWLAAYDLGYIGALSDALVEAGFATWTLEYRRVGNDGGGWPGTFEDIARGADLLRTLARDHSLDLERILAVGHSAGGHLALWLASRPRLDDSSNFLNPDSIRIRGVLGLAAAADLGYLWEKQVCGHVIEGLMGGSPEDYPDRYRLGSPVETVPLDVPQVLVNGGRDGWTATAMRYYEAATAAGADVRIVEAPDSGHFEMIDPASTTWPLVRQAALDLLELVGSTR